MQLGVLSRILHTVANIEMPWYFNYLYMALGSIFGSIIHNLRKGNTSIMIENKCMSAKENFLTVSRHSKCQTFLQSTSLASVSVHPVNEASLLSCTMIVYNWALWSSKKSFAAFACNNPVVDTTWFISTHFARDDLNLGWKDKKGKISFMFHSHVITIKS